MRAYACVNAYMRACMVCVCMRECVHACVLRAYLHVLGYVDEATLIHNIGLQIVEARHDSSVMQTVASDITIAHVPAQLDDKQPRSRKNRTRICEGDLKSVWPMSA